MKRFFIFLFVLMGAVACIDESYDLTKVEGDDVAIGNNSSEFRMPLAHITLTAEQLISESDSEDSDIISTYQEANIWLPSELPGEAEFVEVLLLQEDSAYLQSILNALFDEMVVSEQKRIDVCTLLATKYREEFISVLPTNLPSEVVREIENASVEEAASLIGDLFLDEAIRTEISQSIGLVAEHHLTEMQVKDVVYDIGNLGLGSDIEKMLIDNLDPRGTEPAINALYLYGTIDSEFPFYLLIDPHLDGTDIDLGPLRVTHEVYPIEEKRLYIEDVQTIFAGTTLTMPIRISRYYPNQGLDEKSEVHIHLMLRKTGALKL